MRGSFAESYVFRKPQELEAVLLQRLHVNGPKLR